VVTGPLAGALVVVACLGAA